MGQRNLTSVLIWKRSLTSVVVVSASNGYSAE
jgi:hypothetical protein